MYVRHLYNKTSKRTLWVSLFIDRNTAVCFAYFEIGGISQEVLKKFRNKSITRNIFRTMNLLCEDFIVSLS